MFHVASVYKKENIILSGEKKTRLRCRKRRFSAVVFKSSQMEIQLKNSVLNLGYRFTNWLCSCVAFKHTAVFIMN